MQIDTPTSPERATASATRRVAGWLIDYTLVMIPAVILVGLAIGNLVNGLPSYVGGVAGELGWSKLVALVTHRGAEPGALGAAASGEWVSFAAPLILAILAVPLIQFAYQATLLAWSGRTVGKMILDTRVDSANAATARSRRRIALRRATSTTVAETGLVSVALVIVVLGQFSIGAFLWLLAVVAFWINAFAALGTRRRTVVDRLSGSIVVRRALYAEVAVRTALLAHRASATAVAAGHKSTGAAGDARRKTVGAASAASRITSDTAVALGRRTSDAAAAASRITADAAAIAGQLTREGTEALLQTAPVQQIRDSRAAQQAQALGSAGAGRAREIGGQAASRARRVGGRAQQLWQARQARREQGGEPAALPEEPGDWS